MFAHRSQHRVASQAAPLDETMKLEAAPLGQTGEVSELYVSDSSPSWEKESYEEASELAAEDILSNSEEQGCTGDWIERQRVAYEETEREKRKLNLLLDSYFGRPLLQDCTLGLKNLSL